jgi:UDP-2,3-diacylglucosamine pyrophosphatase LpxH
MLVFISDLHFRDKKSRSIPPVALERFLKYDLPTLIDDAQAEELILVFLGDIFDINRSETWFEGSGRLRPWSNYRKLLEKDRDYNDTALRDISAQILEDIFKANPEFFGDGVNPGYLGQFLVFCSQKGLKTVRVEYIPGNHDRLCNCWPELRKLVCDKLHLKWDPQKLFDVEKSYFNDGYPVFAFHGHVMDPNNYGGREKRSDFSRKETFLLPCLGDVVTVDLSVKLPFEIQKRRPPADVVQALEVIDEVRPIKALPDWVEEWKINHRENAVLVDEVVNECLEAFFNEPFVRWWMSRQGAWLPFYLVARWLRPLVTINTAIWFFKRLIEGPATFEHYRKSMVEQLNGVYGKRILTDFKDCHYLVSGHTHRPIIIPLDREEDVQSHRMLDRIYFNTGTWVGLSEKAEQRGFVSWKNLTYVVFYRNTENRNNGSRNVFEVWNGSLKIEAC